MLSIDQLYNILLDNSKDLTDEFKRVFHGRGGVYEGWKDITIDSIDNILNITLFYKIDQNIKKQFIAMIFKYIQSTSHDTVILQRRYEKDYPLEVLKGNLKDENYAIENGIKIKLNLKNNQNSGYFPDMKTGREFIRDNAQDKNILNLFSYTCGFSLFAAIGGAKSITNVDMSKSALSTGRENHHLNDIDTSNIHFMPYNILKSFSRIKKNAPYDIIIIDPPTLQKGSFEASKDYIKIIRRLEQLSKPSSIILACLNAPNLDEDFLIELFKNEALDFKFEKRLKNPKEFLSADEQRSLKNLVFIKK